AFSATYAAHAAYASSAYDASSSAAAYAADGSGGVKKTIEKAILSDLELITQDRPISPPELLQCPLWPSGQIPEVLAPPWKRFCEWVEALDEGFEFWLDWYRDRLAGKTLDPALLKKQMNIPAEIEDQGPKAVNAYLLTLETETVLKQLNLVCAIFIGNGASGKTSLIRALHGEPVVEGKEKMTPGIDIRSWPVGETAITAKFWDFGGQVMSHATHQFFLRERCLYVLVLNARSEINANDEAEYWLDHVKAFGKNAPVMLIGNKFDLMPVNLNEGALCEKHPNIVGFYPLSCTEAKGRFQSRFETFRGDLIEELQKVGTHQVYFTKQQFAVLEAVRQRSPKNAFLSQDEFKKICSGQGIGEAGVQNRAWLLDLLDKLGEVIHFPQMTTLDSFVLNPRWLTYGVYTLLYSDEVNQNKGELSEAEVIRILRSKTVEDEDGNKLRYPPSKCSFILDAMEEFKLCYRLPEDHRRFVIPDKLPSKQPEVDFDKEEVGTLVFEFDFQSFLPRHVMPTLIVSRHEEIVDGWVWQNGVILQNEVIQAKARVQVDYHDRVLNIWVQGNGKKEMLAILRDEITKILKRMEELKYEEKVVLSASARIGERMGGGEIEKAPYRQLVAMARKRQGSYISGSGAEYDLNKVLGEIMSDEKQKEAGVVVNQTFNAPVGAVGGVGDHQQVTGTVNITLKKAAMDLDADLKKLKLEVADSDADEGLQLKALKEIKEIRKLLACIEKANPAEKKTLGAFIEKIKNGSLATISLVKNIDGGGKALVSIAKQAVFLSGFLP
ncbi:MAG: COR domain-containing protein, partial [Nitrospiria bacterium]